MIIRSLALLIALNFHARILNAQCVAYEIQDPLTSAAAIDGGVLYVANAGGPVFDPIGTVQLYESTPSGWTPTESLTASDPRALHFGRAIAVDGDDMIVSSDNALHFFEKVAGSWTETQEIQGDAFGAIGLGDVVALGSERALAIAVGAGVVAFHKQASVWIVDGLLPGPSVAVLDLAVDATHAFVGAAYDETLAEVGGAVYVYRRSAQGWAWVDLLGSSNIEPFDQFGFSISLDGNRLAVGAPGTFCPSECAPPVSDQLGNCYLFERTGLNWDETQHLTAGGAEDLFGYSVQLDGTTLLVSATRLDKLLLYEDTGSGYTLAGEIDPIGNPTGVGYPSMELDSGYAAVGTTSVGPVQANSLLLYSMDGSDCMTLFTAPGAISVSNGIAQEMSLNAGTAHANQIYLVLGSASGTTPGVGVHGVTVPLAIDAYFWHSLLHPNTSPLVGSLGVLDDGGRGTSWVAPAPFGASVIGLELDHAYVVIDADEDVVFASEARGVTLY